jgi:hypothetical protein
MDFENANFSEVEIESENVVEYEVSEFISLMYDISSKKFYISGIDYEDTFDEFVINIDDSFDGIELDGVLINRSDFDDFKLLVENLNV